MQILLQVTGRRVKTKKLRGSYEKVAALTVISSVDSGSGVFLAVGSKSVGSYALRARGWGRAAAGDQTRGGARMNRLILIQRPRKHPIPSQLRK